MHTQSQMHLKVFFVIDKAKHLLICYSKVKKMSLLLKYLICFNYKATFISL